MITMITGNDGKFAEALNLIPQLQRRKLDLEEIQSVEVTPVIEKKLEQAARAVDGAILVEDVGLFCAGLNGMPGALIKWFLERLAPAGLYEQVRATGDMAAEAICVVGFKNDNSVEFFEGRVSGQIVAPRGEGFGWDSIFQPEGSEKTFGEMTLSEKQRCSMRAIALQEFANSKNIDAL